MGSFEKGHRESRVWQEAVELSVLVVQVSKSIPPGHGFVLRDQMQRSAMSVPNNIAEGSGRGTKKDFLSFLRIARGSLRELDTQVEVGVRTGAINPEQSDEMKARCESVGKMLTRLIQSLQPPRTDNA